MATGVDSTIVDESLNPSCASNNSYPAAVLVEVEKWLCRRPDCHEGRRGEGQRIGPHAMDQDPAYERSQRDDVYRMVHSPRGLCIIINNFNFRGSSPRRDGSEYDARDMKDLFIALHFQCILGTDMTAYEMKMLLSMAAMHAERESPDCLVVILMSHGREGTILSADGVPLHLDDDVYALFNNENCPGLEGKPKVFFIQACRGDKEDSATGPSANEAADAEPLRAAAPQPSSSSTRKRTATWSDMYIAYATIPGYKAVMNRGSGSWFLSAVRRMFTQHAGTMHLEELMHLVHNEVMGQSSDDGWKQTPSVELRGWRKKLYFNPGFCNDPSP
ncbi:hypothetical protein MTO96_018962 [Rhipicephalus appendiculatus]